MMLDGKLIDSSAVSNPLSRLIRPNSEQKTLPTNNDKNVPKWDELSRRI